MGIENLLTFVKPASTEKDIYSYCGKSVAVDAMCWLHRGAVACAYELLIGADTDKFLNFFLKLTNNLIAAGITPIIVFDGDSLPAKAAEEIERKARRNTAREEALNIVRNSKINQASPEYQDIYKKAVQAISVTPQMISRVMNALRKLNVQFYVAPYEADAQLAYLCRTGVVSAVLTEDSDLLAYGCPVVLTKYDHRSGRCIEINLEWAFGLDRAPKPDNIGDLGRFTQWTIDTFVDLCIFSGCDYGGNVHGIGIKNAFRLLVMYRTGERVLRVLEDKKKLKNFKESLDSFIAARNVFRYHWVFDVKTGACTRITPYLDDDDEVINASTGPPVKAELSRDVMLGDVEAKTGLRRELVAFTPLEKQSVDFLLGEKENLEKMKKNAIEAKIAAEMANIRTTAQVDFSSVTANFKQSIAEPETHADYDSPSDCADLLDLIENACDENDVSEIQKEEPSVKKQRSSNPFSVRKSVSSEPEDVKVGSVILPLKRSNEEALGLNTKFNIFNSKSWAKPPSQPTINRTLPQKADAETMRRVIQLNRKF